MRVARLTLSIVALALAVGPAVAAADGLNAYRVKATPKNLKALSAAGFDVTEGLNRHRGTIDVVGTARQVGADKLDAQKLTSYREPAQAPKTAQGKAAKGAARVSPTDGADDSAFTVWTKYDAVAADDKEQYTEQYDRLLGEFPGIVKERVVGTTANGRDIIALQVTKGATGADIPGRPAVLYTAMQHAREWLAGETCRRTLDHVTADYGKTTSAGKEVTKLVDETELWFVCVANPDGYEFTFTPGHRLWRKNLRDNDTNGVITDGDGVDPNRNYPSNWGRDDEGSSPDPRSETYRGPSAASEPETQAMQALFQEIHPVFHKNDHTAAQLLLYPQGFQQDTPTPDNPIFTALAGDPFKPGVEGFLPELSAGLYITNGDFTDYAYNMQGTLSFTPEGTAAEDPDVSGFEYADSPLQIDQEYRRHLQFALDLAKSASHPDEPTSHLGNEAADFDVDAFKLSYGDPQAVGAVVKRSLGTVTMRYKVDGGPTQVVPTTDYLGGERYNKDPGVFYKRVRGFVVGTAPGQKVEAWFTAGGEESAHFTYDAVSETTNPVLLLANEDWSGKQPEAGPGTGPKYLDAYKAALDAAGVKYDVYDIDARGRIAPNALGILSHYSHVIWYSGDDYVTRAPDAPGGSGMDRLAVDTQNEVRDFLNDGGKLFYSGKNAGREFAEGYTYNPFQVEEGTYCQNANPTCIAAQDDFLQYWLGAYRRVLGGGENPDDGVAFPVEGSSGPFAGLDLQLDPTGGVSDVSTSTLLTTSSVLNPATYPLFADSAAAADWIRPYASPFDPHAGSWFLSAGYDDSAYKRLLKPFSIPAGGGKVDFWTSYDLEPDYDFMFVEIRTAGDDDWTTLADTNGHTSDDPGLSCPTTGDGSAWQTIHPFLAHYQTVVNAGADCDPTGSSGTWNATTGNSGGWQHWQLPIPAAYAGENVEIAISVASDPAVQGLGTWVDELQVLDSADAPINSADPSFESGIDGWTLPGPAGPAGPAGQNPATGWVRAQSAPFVESPIVTTTDTVYTGFGLEAVTDAADRTALVAAAMQHLGAPAKPHPDAPAPTPADPGTGGAGGPAPPPVGKPPVVGPKPTPPRKRLSTLKLGGSRSLAAALSRGLAVTARCTVGCKLAVKLTVDTATQRRYRLPARTVGTAVFSLTKTGSRTVRVRLTAAARRRLKSARRLVVTVSVIQVGAKPAVKRTVRITLLR
jgi:murein tripeptide amidase MpaA